MRHSSIALLLSPVFAAAAAATSAASAQTVPVVRPANATELPDVEFSRIVDARELKDGRLLVSDAIEKQLYVVDFAKGTSARLGRQGAGPGEYRSPGRMLALAGDSTLLIDALGGRWLVMSGVSFAGVVTNSEPAMAGGRSPLGADARGHLLGQQTARNLEGAVGTLTMTNDSSWLVRVDRKTGALDTLGKFRVRPARINITGTSERPTSITVTMNPIATGEQPVIFEDGAIAIARIEPYRVDWIVGGRKVAGKPLPFTAVPMTREEKIAVLKRSPNADGTTRTPEEVQDWPETIPPFTASGVSAGPGGRVWIRRTPGLRAPATDYDVVDRTGRVVRRVHLPANEYIVAFGRSSMYVVATDDDGLQHLKRYPLPK